jgi:hypothetical protein
VDLLLRARCSWRWLGHGRNINKHLHPRCAWEEQEKVIYMTDCCYLEGIYDSTGVALRGVAAGFLCLWAYVEWVYLYVDTELGMESEYKIHDYFKYVSSTSFPQKPLNPSVGHIISLNHYISDSRS